MTLLRQRLLSEAFNSGRHPLKNRVYSPARLPYKSLRLPWAAGRRQRAGGSGAREVRVGPWRKGQKKGRGGGQRQWSAKPGGGVRREGGARRGRGREGETEGQREGAERGRSKDLLGQGHVKWPGEVR